MPLLRFSRNRRTIPTMQSVIAAIPAVEPRQFERAVERARERLESIADTVSNETVSEIIEDLKREAMPMAARAVPIIERAAERATGRRRKSRRPKVALIAVALAAVAGVVAYLFWQRRDEQPAYLSLDPDRPDLNPAQTPPSTPDAPAPGSGPASSVTPAGAPVDAMSSPPARDPAAPAREFAGTPHAIFGLGERDEFDDRPVEGMPGLPVTARATVVPPLPPAGPRRSWLPR